MSKWKEFAARGLVVAAVGTAAAAVAYVTASGLKKQVKAALLTAPSARSANEGMTRRFDVRIDSETALDGRLGDGGGSGSGTSAPIALGLAGVAEIQVFRLAVGVAEARVTLATKRIEGGTAAGLDEGKFAEELARGILVRLAEDGRIDVVAEESQPFETSAGETLRLLASAAQVALPLGPAKAWNARERDATGSYQARYQITGGSGSKLTITKDKSGYEDASNAAVSGSQGGSDGGQPRLGSVSGDYLIEMDAASGWIRALKGEETAEVRLGAAQTPFSMVRTRLALTFRGESPLAAADLLTLRTRATFAVRPVPPAEGNDAVALNDFDRNLAYARISDATTVADLATEADGLAANGVTRNTAAGRDLLLKLRAYMALHETDLAPLAKELGKRQTDELFVQATLGAAALSGCKSCQQLLVNDLNLRLASTDVPAGQVSLLVNLAEIPLPSREAEDLARAYARTGQFPETRKMAHVLLGLMAYHVHDVDPPRAAAIVGEFAAVLAAATDDEARLLALDVLGNSGHESVPDLVKPFLETASPAIRERAVTALRLVPTADAAELARGSLRDAAAAVRDASVRVLADRPVSAAYVPDLIEHLGRETSADVKRRVLRALDAHAALPVVQAALERTARDAANESIRDLAARVKAEAPTKAKLLQ